MYRENRGMKADCLSNNATYIIISVCIFASFGLLEP